MNDKIVFADLVTAVSSASNIPKNRCDDFVRTFFDTIANALAVDGVVKVKGLGTFKLVAVEERKSVNVQNGAEMIIPAHNKVSFTPDKVLKDEVNKPYAHLKTYVLNPDAPLDPPEQEDDECVDDAESPVQSTDSNFPSSIEAVASDVTDAQDGAAVSSNETESTDKIAEEVITQIKNEAETHSDWFDNWEVEYDGSVQDDNNSSTSSKDQSSTPLSSLLSKKSEVESVDVNGGTSSESEDKVEDGLSNNRQSSSEPSELDLDQVGVGEPNVPSQTEGDNQSTANGEQADQDNSYTNAGNVPDSTILNTSDAVQVPSAEVNSDEINSSDTTLVENVNNGLAQIDPQDQRDINNGDVTMTEKESHPLANSESEAASNESDTNSKATIMETDTDNQQSNAENNAAEEPKATNKQEPDGEKVQHGKVFGVAIIAALVSIVAIIFGLNRIDPDFFAGLKASSDEPPVMPTDTTSLAQELSEYAAENDNDSIVEQNVIEAVTEELSNESPIQQSIDPLWDGEFVAYMKRLHPDCNLVNNGLKNEVTIKRGLFLTMIALENYGDKSYWIYLYLYNKDRIKNPNNITIGTKIRVPDLDKSLVDGTNEDKLSLAKQLRQVFVK